jgi:hypothetical protein
MARSARSYMTADANGEVECVSEIPGRHLTIYSVPRRGSILGQARERLIADLIVWPHGANRIAAERLADYQGCPGSEPEVGQ